jgi:hypothetical protein
MKKKEPKEKVTYHAYIRPDGRYQVYARMDLGRKSMQSPPFTIVDVEAMVRPERLAIGDGTE